MSWIKIENALPDKPEVMRLSAILGVDEVTVIGHLVLFWAWADGQVSANCPVITGTKSGLDRRAGVSGFCDAMLEVGWLEQSDSTFVIPNFCYHMGKSAKTRAEEQKRKAVSRNRPDKTRTSVPVNEGQMSHTSPDKTRTR